MIHNTNIHPVRFNDRLFFVLIEVDDGNVFPHGIVAAPPEMDEAQARHCIERMERWAIGSQGHTWNWGHVIVALEKKGFQFVQPGYFVEKGPITPIS